MNLYDLFAELAKFPHLVWKSPERYDGVLIGDGIRGLDRRGRTTVVFYPTDRKWHAYLLGGQLVAVNSAPEVVDLFVADAIRAQERAADVASFT